jgi:hypothetical protein
MMRSISGRMNRDDFDNSRRYPALIFSLIFLAVILIISLTQNSQIILVLALYLCIFLEGISISAFVIYSRSSGKDAASSVNESARPSSPKGTDVVSSMNVYLSYAEKGSSHSRREIALIIRNLLNDSQARKREELDKDPFFQADLNKVVFRYTDHYETVRNSGARYSRGEREAYLNSLERVILRLSSE